MRKLQILVISLILAGCASTGPVPIGKDTYMISKQSAGGMFVAASSIKGEILREANTFCTSTGKVMQIVNSRELSAIPAVRMPSAEVQFMCLNETDSEVARPKLKKVPDTVIEINNK